jgi:hypothetical protein
MDKEKAIIADGLSSLAPPFGLEYYIYASNL